MQAHLCQLISCLREDALMHEYIFYTKGVLTDMSECLHGFSEYIFNTRIMLYFMWTDRFLGQGENRKSLKVKIKSKKERIVLLKKNKQICFLRVSPCSICDINRFSKWALIISCVSTLLALLVTLPRENKMVVETPRRVSSSVSINGAASKIDNSAQSKIPARCLPVCDSTS